MFYALAVLLQIIGIGALAQVWKKRTGAVWALIALALDVAGALFLDNAIASRPGPRPVSLGHDIAFAVMVLGASTILCVIVIATLPRRPAQA